MTYKAMFCTIGVIVLGITDAVMVGQHGEDGDLIQKTTGLHTVSYPFILLAIGYGLGRYFGWMPRKSK